jgi:hypothetical protein
MLQVRSEWADAMRRGDYAKAWAIEERALAKRNPDEVDNPALPYHLRWVWDGTPLDGKHVLVRCYHGLGDTLQYARFLPALAERAASVTVEAPAKLHCLLDRLPCLLEVFDPASPLARSQCDIEIMELAFALRLEPMAVPAAWLEWEAFETARGAVGICLRAGEWDHARSVPSEIFTDGPFARKCFSLDIGRSSLPVLNSGGAPDDIAATAALVCGCDAILTVDTMIAHLAGALGKPTWLMLKHSPDWRWCPHLRNTDWYPSFNVVTQPAPGQWEPVVRQVRMEAGL